MGALWNREIVRRLVAYVVVGGVGTVVYLAIYNGLRAAMLPLVANAIATTVALFLSFWGNRRLAFGVAGQDGMGKDFVLFSVVFFGTLAVSSGALIALFALIEQPGRLAENVALLTATAITFVLRYVLLSRWVFRSATDADPGGVRGA
jgi:putative flippase GtrA